jgi:Restriction endonuclease XhoI
MTGSVTPSDWSPDIASAVAFFWKTRRRQVKKQRDAGRTDQGSRAAVTGGAQMDGFITLMRRIISTAGIPEHCVFTDARANVQLPGFFRPTKEWDIVVVVGGQLVLAIEAKSHVGPSFGNNFNNRTEEAMGSALDLWTAFREGAFNSTIRPWLGYLLLLEDCAATQRPVKPREPHFEVFPEFKRASYAERYQVFCRRLVRERKYDAACLVTSTSGGGVSGHYDEPAPDLRFNIFARALIAHASAYAA